MEKKNKQVACRNKFGIHLKMHGTIYACIRWVCKSASNNYMKTYIYMQLINFSIQFLHIDIQVQAIYRLFLIIQQIKCTYRHVIWAFNLLYMIIPTCMLFSEIHVSS